MRKQVSINDMTKIHKNLWKLDNQYFRMFGHGITPNGCWIINPISRELIDIDIATGNDVYGLAELEFGGIVGTVSSSNEFITQS